LGLWTLSKIKVKFSIIFPINPSCISFFSAEGTMAPSDDRLIEQYLNGDVDAFERLYERYSARLLGFLKAHGVCFDIAEDLAQRTWMRVIENLSEYQAQGTFRAWLFTLGHRLFLDEARSAWERHRVVPQQTDPEAGSLSFVESVPAPHASPLEQAVQKEEGELLAQAIEQLPDAIRQTVLLRIDGDLAFREIAEVMQCPLGTVLWRMQEARRLLRKLLGEPEASIVAEQRLRVSVLRELKGDQG
jgi:RNA polymerase sigma factor (sigma-70 family)